jgi:uncharacterized membrane protein YhaH (DUF805 family)
MDFVGAIKAGFNNYVNFRGTATRPEFWYWFLFTFLVAVVTSAIDQVLTMVPGLVIIELVFSTITTLFSLATFLPTLAVTVRRLRDAGFSWVWLLLPLPFVVPFVVGIAQLAIALVDLGIDPMVLVDPEVLDPAALQILAEDEATAGAFLLTIFGFLALLLVSLLVNTIFEIFPSKSFEQGNKRVAPKGTETPAL